MPSIDFEKFKAEVTLADVVHALHMDVGRLHVLWKRAPCPFCQHEDHRCLNLNWNESTWYCHRCKRGGSQVDFAMHARGLDAVQAVMLLCPLLGRPIPYRPRVRTRRTHRNAAGEIIAGDDDDDPLD